MNRLRLKNGIAFRVLAVLLLSFAVLLPSVAFAAGESVVSDTRPDSKLKVAAGVVIDKKTGEAVISANVAVWADGKLLTGTSTDFEGNFRIISPVSDFELRISFIG